VDIATDLGFIVEAVAGDKPIGICFPCGGSLNSSAARGVELADLLEQVHDQESFFLRAFVADREGPVQDQ
jgi:hypothetical protein